MMYFYLYCACWLHTHFPFTLFFALYACVNVLSSDVYSSLCDDYSSMAFILNSSNHSLCVGFLLKLETIVIEMQVILVVNSWSEMAAL